MKNVYLYSVLFSAFQRNVKFLFTSWLICIGNKFNDLCFRCKIYILWVSLWKPQKDSLLMPPRLLNRAPTSTQLHPRPPSSFQSPPSCIHLHPATLTENWHSWYIGRVDPKSRLRFLKFRPQNSFLGKFGPKNSNMSVLSENWYAQYLKDADSESRPRFFKFWPQSSFLGRFGPKKLKLSVFSENWYT